MPTRLICPNCRTVLSVRDNASAQITCLRCLAVVVNPNSTRTEIPRPAIPVDQEASRDVGGTTYLLAILGFLMAAGMFIAFASGNIGLGLLLMITVGGLIIISLVHRAQVWAQLQMQSRSQSAGSAQVGQRQDWSARSSAVLNYAAAPALGAGAVVLRGCAAAFLVGAGVLLLLFGMCFALGVLSGPWPPK